VARIVVGGPHRRDIDGMRTPAGSSKIVARSRPQSSPACEPKGVILTFCAKAIEHAPVSQAGTRAVSILMP